MAVKALDAVVAIYISYNRAREELQRTSYAC